MRPVIVREHDIAVGGGRLGPERRGERTPRQCKVLCFQDCDVQESMEVQLKRKKSRGKPVQKSLK